MEFNSNYVFCCIFMGLVSLVWLLIRDWNTNHSDSKLPPGPKGWPVFGNIFDIGRLPHRTLAKLKQQHGPVVWLRLGSVNTMVLLSATAAEEMYKNHDLDFINRQVIETMRSHDFCNTAMVMSPYNAYWRTLRRICNAELFTTKKINETMLIRQKCVDDMLLQMEKEVGKGVSGGIELTEFVIPALFNMIGNLTVSRDLADAYSTVSSEFNTAMSGFEECLGRPNISDVFHWLRWLDLQGLRRKMDLHLGKAIEIVSGFVNERVKERQKKEGGLSEQRKDFLDVLLNFEGNGKDEPANLSDRQITVFLMEMFFGAMETTSGSTEWAMTELLQNPEAMSKAKAELTRVVGANKKLEESDIDNLPYLRATVEETLRLHPPAPLLLPNKAMKDTNFMGYSIPKDTQVFVNIWAIGRDEESWVDASSFKPERFIDSKIGYRGQNYEFLPFGAGRRICPGLPLAHRLLPLILGSLLHHFDWELPEGETTLDMRETMGTTARKLQPLKAVPKRIRTE